MEGPTLQGSLSRKDAHLQAVADNGEVVVYVTESEPTAILFEENVQGGWKKLHSGFSLDRMDNRIIIFPSTSLSERGEAILVRLESGKLIGIRIQNSDAAHPRNVTVSVKSAAFVVP